MYCGFKVLNAGILTLVQDKGRFGYNALGVTTSGVMDEYAYYYANKLLDNDLNENCLEILFTGLTLQASHDCTISITGADLSLCINENYYKPWQSITIKAGDILKFNKSIVGQRAYLSVKGGFIINKAFNSVSTTLKEGLGGIEGRAIKKEDVLQYNSSLNAVPKRLKKEFCPNYDEPVILRVVLGYQEETFSKEEKEKFFTKEFAVSNDNNRMAIKLKGESILSSIEGIISEGISFGAIQIPKDGQPIVLLKERQTIGGYPKIGSVLSIDCFKLSQVKPNSCVRFEEISLEKAQEKVKTFYSQFK